MNSKQLDKFLETASYNDMSLIIEAVRSNKALVKYLRDNTDNNPKYKYILKGLNKKKR